MKLEYTADEKDQFIKDCIEELLSHKYNDYFFDLSDERSFANIVDRIKQGEEKEYEEEFFVEDEEALGWYERMQSPGRITLNIGRISKSFERSVIHIIRTGHYVTSKEYIEMADLMIRKTFYHEYFHHFSDIQAMLFRFGYDHDIEEALAVAWSREKMNNYVKDLQNKSGNKKKMTNGSLINIFLDKIYRYSGAGYRDWKNYVLQHDFSNQCIHYMFPHSAQQLIKNGVHMHLMVMENLDSVLENSHGVKLQMKL